VLSRYHGLRYEEVAAILNCEVGAVKVRAYRALKELRETFHQLRGDKIYEL
jgi:RNA polymerase sigma-70 factor (ECF subfamily)